MGQHGDHKAARGGTNQYKTTNRKIPDFVSEIRDFGFVSSIAGEGFEPAASGYEPNELPAISISNLKWGEYGVKLQRDFEGLSCSLYWGKI